MPTYKDRMKGKVDGVKDTLPKDVLEITYKGEDFLQVKQEFDQFIKEKERRESIMVFPE